MAGEPMLELCPRRRQQNFLRGAGAWNLDAAMQKNVKIAERFGLQFRAEGFNVFNHHDLSWMRVRFIGLRTGRRSLLPTGPIPNTMVTGAKP